jgi:hypothetical protein
VADAMSRRDTKTAVVMTLSSPSFQLFDNLRQEIEDDLTFCALRADATTGTHGKDWRVVDGLILVAGRIYLPVASPTVPLALAAAHGAGHEVAKTLHCLRVDFHVPGARALVAEFVRACETCQRNKAELLHPASLLQPLDIPSTVWADISMDFVEGFLCVHIKSVILMVVDRFLKYAHFIVLGHPYTTTSVARAFFNDIVRLHGIPSSIVSDRDPVFTSKFWTELFMMAGVKLNLLSAFYRSLTANLKR